jgi:arylsulfatase A
MIKAMKSLRILTFLLTILIFTNCSEDTINNQPNIVFILADDMGFDSVSANNDKIGNMKTPHIDKLASEGMSFSDAHSGSSVCTPTRYGLLTGRYAWRTRLKSKVLWQWGSPLIEKERLTVADMLKANGYKTGIVGKWHLGMDWYGTDGKILNSLQDGLENQRPMIGGLIDFSKPIGGGPIDHGFDYYFGVDVPNFPPYAWIENNKVRGNPTETKPKEMFGIEGPMVPGWKLEEILPTLAQKAEQWITKQSQDNQPFFLYLALTSPHKPIAPSKDFLGKSGISEYADFVIETDWVVGHIAEALENAGIADNTLLIFSTDNGTTKGAIRDLATKNIDLLNHFKGHKLLIDEGGHRVPFIARWPGVIKPNSTCKQTICLNDFMATVAELLDVSLPDNAAEDSYSILGLLTGEENVLSDRPFVVNHDFWGGFAIRKGKWKLVDTEEKSLFDLDADIKETTDIVEQYPEVAKELSDVLKKYRESGRSSGGN